MKTDYSDFDPSGLVLSLNRADDPADDVYIVNHVGSDLHDWHDWVKVGIPLSNGNVDWIVASEVTVYVVPKVS